MQKVEPNKTISNKLHGIHGDDALSDINPSLSFEQPSLIHQYLPDDTYIDSDDTFSDINPSSSFELSDINPSSSFKLINQQLNSKRNHELDDKQLDTNQPSNTNKKMKPDQCLDNNQSPINGQFSNAYISEHYVLVKQSSDENEIVKYIVALNDDVFNALINYQSEDQKMTILMNASESNHIKVVETILNRHKLNNCCNLNLQNNKGNTALMIAIECNNLYIANLLRFHHHINDFNLTNNEDHTALMLAIKNIAIKNDGKAMAKYFINSNADVNLKDKKGNTALMIAIECDHPYIANLLINHTEIHDFNLTNNEGHTALMLATKYNRKNIAESLIEKNVNINFANTQNETALMIGAENNCLNMVKYLVKSNADVNLKDNQGKTALMIATEKHFFTVVEFFMINSRTDINLQNNQGKTALMISIEDDNKKINKTRDLIESFTKKNADVNLKDNQGNTVLMLFISKIFTQTMHQNGIKANIPFMQLLMNKSDLNLTNDEGNTALMIAIKNNFYDVANVLIESKHNFNLTNNDGHTALMLATKSYIAIAESLIQNNVDINFANTQNETTLMIAIKNNRTDIAKLLIEKNANVNCKNHKGEIALVLAIINNDLDTSKLLIGKSNNFIEHNIIIAGYDLALYLNQLQYAICYIAFHSQYHLEKNFDTITQILPESYKEKQRFIAYIIPRVAYIAKLNNNKKGVINMLNRLSDNNHKEIDSTVSLFIIDDNFSASIEYFKTYKTNKTNNNKNYTDYFNRKVNNNRIKTKSYAITNKNNEILLVLCINTTENQRAISMLENHKENKSQLQNNNKTKIVQYDAANDAANDVEIIPYILKYKIYNNDIANDIFSFAISINKTLETKIFTENCDIKSLLLQYLDDKITDSLICQPRSSLVDCNVETESSCTNQIKHCV